MIANSARQGDHTSVNFYIAVFVIAQSTRDSHDINDWIESYDYQPVISAENLHVFLLQSNEQREEIEAHAQINLQPEDRVLLFEHPAPQCIPEILAETLQWAKKHLGTQP